MKERRFSITNKESLAVEAGLSLLKAELNKIQKDEGFLSPYWTMVKDIAIDLLARLNKYCWFK